MKIFWFYLANIPRYVRVNRNVTSMEHIVQYLKRSHPKFPEYEVLPEELDPYADLSFASSSKSFLLKTSPPHFFFFKKNSKAIYWDPHISDLLAFDPSVSFQNNPAYLDGRLILQDKASCLPAFLLAPPIHEKTHAVDATAAPGNKTSHLSAVMCNIGKVCSFKREWIKGFKSGVVVARISFILIQALDLCFWTGSSTIQDTSENARYGSM